MYRPEKNGDLDDIRQKTAIVHEKLVSLLLEVAPHVREEESRRKKELLIRGFQPAMGEWTENRLADLSLWINNLRFMARPEVSAVLYHLKSAIASLLALLGSLLEVCRISGEEEIARGSWLVR